MTDAKSPIDQALDLFVYAPLGLALSARDELPKLAERGRQQVETQLTMARMIGQFAVGEAGRRLTPQRSGPSIPHQGAGSTDQNEPVLRTTRSNGSSPTFSAEGLAIHGYDALAASQVVQRLAGLSVEELDAVRRYEEATRHRKTILNRVTQLQTGNPSAP